MPRNTDTAAAEQVEAIEKDLSRGRGRLALSEPLETAFQEATLDERLRAIRSWHWAAVVANLACLLLDHLAGILAEGIVLRVGVVIPAYCMAILLLRPRHGPTVIAAAVGGPLVLMAGSVAVLAQLAPAPEMDRYLMALGLLLLLVNIAVPLSFRQAASSTLACLALMPLAAFLVAAPTVDELALQGFIAVVAFVSLAVRFRAERTSRDVFLSRLRDNERVAELVRMAEALAATADTDAMTGLFNRRHLARTLASKWDEARQSGEWLGLMMIDVDHFKLLNDAAGHQSGDECLITIADILKRKLSHSSQYLARYGGEEFVALLSRTAPDALLTTAEDLRQAVESAALPHHGRLNTPPVTISIGASATRPTVDALAKELFRAADQALYAAKAAGRNRVEGAGIRDRADLESSNDVRGDPIVSRAKGR